jgi:endo-1,4-beta-xylanase
MTTQNLITIAVLCGAGLADAQTPSAIPLWSGGAPGFESRAGEKEISTPRDEGGGVVFSVTSNIHNPSITPFLPPKEKATGAAVIILPGGAHRFLSIDHEGNDVAKYFASMGVAGFVLKYRLANDKESPYKVETHPVQDAKRAVRLIRSRAKDWGVDPQRIGMLGFSAGGYPTVTSAIDFDAGDATSQDAIERQPSKPDFIALGYSAYPPNFAEKVTASTPPAFIFFAYDDRNDISERSLLLYQALRKVKVPAELHVYSKGGHGYGVRPGPLPVATWHVRMLEWMNASGFVKTKP